MYSLVCFWIVCTCISIIGIRVSDVMFVVDLDVVMAYHVMLGRAGGCV